MENNKDDNSGKGICEQILNEIVEFEYNLSTKDLEKVLKDLNNETTD